MKLKSLTKDEIETMGYDEIALIILQDAGKKMKLQDLFKKVCKALDIDENEFASHITDFFELLSTNKKFVMLKNGYWDLQTRHQTEIAIEETDEETFDSEDEVEEEEEEEEKDESDDDIYYEDDSDDDIAEDDLSDLVIVDEDEEAGS